MPYDPDLEPVISDILARLAALEAQATVPPQADPAPPAEPAPVPAPRINGLLGFAIPDGELLAGGDAWLDRIAALGAKVVRFDIRLGSVMSGSSFNWSNTDRLVNGLTSRGIRVLGLLNASATEVNTAPGRTRFQTFAEAAVRRYADRCQWWEILNEVNHTTLTANQYADLLKAVYPAIKAVQTDAKVCYVGNASVPDADGARGAGNYLRAVYARLAGVKAFDAVGVHPYQYPMHFESQDANADWSGLGALRIARQIMNLNGDQNLPIWITEAGAPTAGGTKAVTPEVQATTLRQIVGMARQPNSGIELVCWYGFRDRPTGTDTERYFGVEAANGTPKQAAAVFRELAAVTV